MTATLLHNFTHGSKQRELGDRPQQPVTTVASPSCRMAGSIVLAVLVGLMSSCSQPRTDEQRTWKVYHNPNYGFEFPYPDNWVPAPLADSQDGRRFRNPYSMDVEILGWASHVSSTPGDSSEQVRRSVLAAPNFTTRQGLRGQLRVEIGATVSLMTLTLAEDGVVYFWQGRSPSDQFSRYYEFFNYVANEYAVTSTVRPNAEPPAQK